MNESDSQLGASLADLKIDRDDREPTGPPRVVLLLLSVLLVAVAAVAFVWLRPDPAPEVTLASAVEVTGGASDVRETVLDASGYVVARLQATVSSRVTGKIVEVLVEEGQAVAKGQVLARLDDSLVIRQVRLAQAQIATARKTLAESEVRLDEAEIELRRTRELVGAEVVTEAQLDTAQAQVNAWAARVERNREEIRVAESQLSLREQELDDTIIRAPFDGVAVTKNAQPGEMISPVSAGGGFTRTGICTLVDMSSLEIEVDVNEAYINRVVPGQRVTATLDAYRDWEIPASVITTVPTADRQKATVRVRIGFDELDPRLLPDMGAKVSFLGEEQETARPAPGRSVLLVPSSAVRQDGGRDIVFVYDGGAVERRAVTVGGRRGERVEVVAGLRNGERVVAEGPEDLEDGSKVREAK
ncbi:MAG: efflux RND transporter periplasmic adaptor subunit [Acidobacteriota bacterium]